MDKSMIKLFIIWVVCVLLVLIFMLKISSADDAIKSQQLNLILKQELNWDGTPKTEIVKKDRQLSKTSDFLIVSGLLVASTIYDVEATLSAGKRGAKEGNSWARSFVEKGRAETYAYSGGIALVTMGISYAIFKSKDPDTQKYWIVLPVIGIASHTVGGTLNILW